MKANPGVPTGFSIKSSILYRQQDPQSFQINVDSCLFIPIDEISTDRTNIGPVRKLQFFVDISALTAGLTGWKPFIYLDDVTAVPFSFIQEHGHEHSPSIISIGFPKIECLFQSRHIQILDTDQVIFPGQLFGKLMQAILTLMLDFRMQLCDYLTLLLIVLRVFLSMGKLPLFPRQLLLKFLVRFLKVRQFSIGIHIQMRGRHIQTDMLHILRRFRVDQLCFWVLKGDGTVPLSIFLMTDRHGLQFSTGLNLPV